ncbi:HD domain-containing protein [bacterium]|nr:HD domain-containing protein [bacterium]
MHAPDIRPLVSFSEGTQYHPAPLATLRADMGANFELYLGINTSRGRKYILYKSHDYDLTEERRQYLIDRGVSTLYVTEKDLDPYFGYVDRAVGKVLDSESTPPSEKSHVVYHTTTSLMKHLYERPDSPIILRTNQKMVTHMVNFLASDSRLLRTVVSMFVYDYSLYTHAVNVATISAGMALKIGFQPGRELEQIGQGFLLHDIGKCKLPTEIVSKPGTLTPSEIAQIQRHPAFGVEQMQGRENIESPALEIILHHHEKLSGRGYPHNLSAKDIQMPVRIAVVADVFDALTSHRSYKAALTGFQALKLMQEQMKYELDSECMRALISLLGPSS